ncbi:MAG TPA: M28 family peptidase [Candidatus Solibacter sp.]|nr:M28 family peptidase [Candidatus Solibacter sp.]
MPLHRCAAAFLFLGVVAGCSSAATNAEKPGPPPAPAVAAPTVQPGDAAPPAAQTAGFDGTLAWDHLIKQVGFGPRPPASPAIARTQEYIKTQLAGFGCVVEDDDFTAQTPVGALRMKNIVAKIPGSGRDIILLLTHYDTVRIDNFVGANDAASSTAVMLEMARLYCGANPAHKLSTASLWIAFLDGEEAQQTVNGVSQWTNEDSVYGSREMSARLAVAGELKRVKAVVLADMIGDRDLRVRREGNSTPWLVDIIWSMAKRLGYGRQFPDDNQGPVGDDHDPFVRRGVSAADLIDFESHDTFWHTAQDTPDKVTPKSLSIVGHVLVESLPQIEKHR